MTGPWRRRMPAGVVGEWLTHGRVPREQMQYRVTSVYLVLLAVVSLSWHVEGMQRAVRDCCLYRGDELTSPGVLKILASALLIPHPWELLAGLVLLGMVLPSFEALVGAWWMVAIALADHVLTTGIVDVVLRLKDHDHLLAVDDTGSSVVLLAAVVTIVRMTGARRLAEIAGAAVLGDVVVNHDLATIEHLTAVTIALLLVPLTARWRRRATIERNPAS